jgi:hypothetical protein
VTVLRCMIHVKTAEHILLCPKEGGVEAFLAGNVSSGAVVGCS